MKTIFILMLVLSPMVYGQVYPSYEVPFNPDRMQALGLGFDAIDKLDRPIECIENNIIDLDSTDNLSAKMSSMLVTNHRELLNKLDIGMKMSADMTFSELLSGEGSFSAHYNKSFKLKEDEISFVLSLSQNYGRKAIVNPRLKPQYQKMLDDKDYELFKSLCGTHYYNMLQNKAMVVAMIKISGLSKEMKEEIDAKFSSALELNAFDMSSTFNASYNKLIEETNKLARTSIEFYSIGGAGIVDLTNVITHSTSKDIKLITQGLAKYAQSMTAQNAAPTKLKMNLYPGYPINAINLSFREKRIIDQLVKNSQYNMDMIKELDKDKEPVWSSYSQYMIDYLYTQIEKNESMVFDCLLYGKCNLLSPKKWDVLTKQTSFKKIKLKSSCEYKEFGHTSYITKLQVRLSANVYFPERIRRFEVLERDKGRLQQLNLAYDLNINLAQQIDENNFEAQSWYKRLYTPLETFYFSTDINGTTRDITSRKKISKELRQKELYIKLYYEDGVVLNKLGKIDLSNCPIVK